MKLFRKFRMASLTKNKVVKYLLYALGEIILVVVGILIALWFNQRNEEKKLDAETRKTARQIVKLIEKDNEDIHNILLQWTSVGQSMDTILYKTKKDKPIPNSCTNCGDIFSGIVLPTLSFRIPETIKDKSLSEGPILETLNKIEYHYLEGVENSKFYNKIVTEYFTEVIQGWQKNEPWFIDYIGNGFCDDSCKKYFYESTDYRNKIAYYNLLLIDGYYFSLIEFKETNVELIDELKTHLNSSEKTIDIDNQDD